MVIQIIAELLLNESGVGLLYAGELHNPDASHPIPMLMHGFRLFPL